MKHCPLYLFGSMLLICSCAPKVSTSISKKYAPLDFREEVYIIGLQEPEPQNSVLLGTVKIGDTGFSTNCSWEVVIDKAKLEARKAGGNAIKITEHTPPNAMSTCHRITARILKVENFDITTVVSSVDTSLIHADYALLHIYRFGGYGALVSYNLHLGDTVLCRVSDNWKNR
jgi:hypothetical protein